MALLFIINSIFLGVGLAMDAFSLSVAYGLSAGDNPAEAEGRESGVLIYSSEQINGKRIKPGSDEYNVMRTDFAGKMAPSSPKIRRTQFQINQELSINKRYALKMSLTFGGFQALMPMLGWLCLHTLAGLFETINRFIPVIAFVLLSYLGIQMIVEGIRKRKDLQVSSTLENSPLIVQGIATSIDAFSAGAAFVPYNFFEALTASLIVAVVTFIICSLGIRLGKRLGLRFADHATILGGVILVLIGVEVLMI